MCTVNVCRFSTGMRVVCCPSLLTKTFISYVVSFDFICLVETFVENIDSSSFSNYTVYCKPAVKLSNQGRHSGGILCLIRNSLVPFVRKLNSNND